MLEKFQELLQKCKKLQNEEPLMEMSLEFVQGLFEMQDVNKWLKYNAMNVKQIENVQKFETNLQKLLEKLYIPNCKLENV